MKEQKHNFLPVLPTPELVLFPGNVIPLRITRPKSVAAVEEAQRSGLPMIVVAEKNDGLYSVGAYAQIDQIHGSATEGFRALVRGVRRIRLLETRESNGRLEARFEDMPEVVDVDSDTMAQLLASLKTLANEILALVPVDTRQAKALVSGVQDLSQMADLCAATLDVSFAVRQELLETVSVKERAFKLLDLMKTQKEKLQVQRDINERLTQKLGKGQREAILREQLKAIQEELGEPGATSSRKKDYAKLIDEAKMPDDVKSVAIEELDRLNTIGDTSPESQVIRNYIETLVAMPWSKSSVSDAEIDLEKAREVLDRDHFGLEKIKSRLLQYLAVMKLKKDGRSPILLFVGPPGVGKTSLGHTIADALGRKFVRGSLGGVRDDAEIRGHRRTYIGAMPGRIAQAIRRAGENNPVFMLDEIDKLAQGYHGDPAAALLEVLDPEQNSKFMDHYLDVPFDLSKVVFVATANSLDSIPAPLLDRMEVIELSGYTTQEKLHIAKKHLWAKQLEEHGLAPDQLEISDEALTRVITHYTREAGVRDLQRKIAAVVRASTQRIVAAKALLPIHVEIADLEEILGPQRNFHEVAELASTPGVVTGLAWTPVGGEILFVEAGLMPGNGRLIMTGQLGDVMKESAQIALSLWRSKFSSLKPGFEFDKHDLHIHVPAGAIPKDGPSAGVTMFSALASLFSDQAIDPKLAMTGELTLRGAVMPVGGIKEKVIAAHRAGIERVILSKKNEKDLKEVPQEVLAALRFDFVENVSELVERTLSRAQAAAAGVPEPAAA